jgi:hypothetical protein
MIMPTPGKPLTSAPLLNAAAVLLFRATTRDKSGATLGVLVNAAGAPQHLAIAEGGADGTWTLSSTLPAGQKPVLLNESAANLLRGGGLDADGTISFQGGSYVIESLFDGKNWTAKVSGSV